MKRELTEITHLKHVSGCCPGHDDFPCETYKNRRSKKRRAKDKAREHRYVRRKLNSIKHPTSEK